jgi:glycosyltransferase involved in cell wall biosynthesis
MAKITIVVHRYYPYPGGSENNVRRAAEALQQAGHDVCVYAGGHQGPQNGVDVNYDISSLYNRDLVIIHGAGVWIQDQIIKNINHINSPIAFWIIRPDTSYEQALAIRDSDLIGWGTQYDIDRVSREGDEYLHKLCHIPYILSEDSIGKPGFKKKHGIETERMILSSGGFWPHKGHQELINVFEENLNDHPNTTLVITGYTGADHNLSYTSNQVKILYLPEMSDVYNGMLEADLYVMNSYDEGFGLVLLEAMQNKTHWISRHIAGADTLKDWGVTYTDTDGLKAALKTDQSKSDLQNAYAYVLENHSAKTMVHAINGMLTRLGKTLDIKEPKKTAILLTGNLRTWDLCKENFIKTFGETADIFICVSDIKYDYAPYIQETYTGYEDSYLTEEDILNSFTGLNIKKILIESKEEELAYIEKEVPKFKLDVSGDFNPPQKFGNVLKIKKGLSLIEEYENENSIKYDTIIKTRFDAVYNQVVLDINDNDILIDSGNCFPNDQFLMSSRDSMYDVINFMYDEFYNPVYSDSHTVPPHTLLLNGMNHNKLNIVKKPIINYIHRKDYGPQRF